MMNSFDWASLKSVNTEDVFVHPDRNKQIVLIGIGQIHSGDMDKGLELINESIKSGVDADFVISSLLKSLNYSLARSHAVFGNEKESVGRMVDFFLLGDLVSNTSFEKAIDGVLRDVFIDLNNISSACDIATDEVDRFFIKKYYLARETYFHYDDSAEEDKWQLEVYLYAYHLMKRHGFETVMDVGCGSGYKLVKYLGDFKTIGFELDVNLPKLNKKYPDRKWILSNFDSNEIFDSELIVCSDVIEHLVDPDILLNWIKRQNCKLIVLSTPDRDLVYKEGANGRDGPPNNPAHVREWNFNEFSNYISHHFEVLTHQITNREQATQMIVCKNKHVS